MRRSKAASEIQTDAQLLSRTTHALLREVISEDPSIIFLMNRGH